MVGRPPGRDRLVHRGRARADSGPGRRPDLRAQAPMASHRARWRGAHHPHGHQRPGRVSPLRSAGLPASALMDGLDLFMMRYDAVHGGFVDELFSDITDGQLRARPHGVNSVAWLIWHASRLQDAAVSRLVGGRPQAVVAWQWGARLGVERRACGPGMTAAEVNQLSAAVDLAALREYHRAVADRTRAIARALTPAAWSEVVPPDLIRRVVTE